MNKEAILEEIYNSSFKDELEKISEDKNGPSLGTGAAAIGASIAPQVGMQVAYTPAVLNMLREADNSPSENRTRSVHSLKKAMGVDSKVFRNSFMSAAGGGGAYNPMDKTVHLYSKNKNLSPKELAMLSHEFGHVKNFKNLGRAAIPYAHARGYGNYGAMGASVYSAFAKDDKKARNAAIAGTVMPGITLAEEATATARGMKGLTKHYGGGRSGFTKALFKGRGGGAKVIAGNIGSYGVLAAAPGIAYGVRKFLKGGKESKDIKK